MSIRATSPYTIYLDADGNPLTGGYVYFGVAGSNPETTPIAIYWDEALTIAAAQPLRTINGFLMRNGSPGSIYTAAVYSVTVKNKNGVLVFSALTNPGIPVSVAMMPVCSAATLAAGLTAFGFSAYIQTLIDDADAVTARATLGAELITSVKTINGADYVILDDDGYTDIEVTTGASDRTITLPARATNSGRRFCIRKADDGAGKVIVVRAGTDTINGTTTWEITEQYGYATLLENGSEWAVRAQEGSVYRTTDTTERSQASPVSATWYNLGSVALTVPIAGIYELSFSVMGYYASVAGDLESVFATLSTGNNSETDKELTACLFGIELAGTTAVLAGTLSRVKRRVTVSGSTPYYLNSKTNGNGGSGKTLANRNDYVTAVIEARRVG